MMKTTFLGKYAFLLTFCLLLTGVYAESAAAAVLDFDGDGKTDFVVERSNENNNYVWYILQSRDGFAATVWGASVRGSFGDALVPADYDGDGKTDVAVVRGITGNPNLYWFILNSRDNTVTTVQWGLRLGDYEVPQDYDGDGKADIAVYRGGIWYIRQSSDNQLYAEQFGATSDIPLRGGDYDGDGKADLAVVRYAKETPPASPVPLTLFIRRSSDRTWASYDLGDYRYTGVLTGDYDGDGRADVAIWQGSLWLWIRSSDNKIDGVRFGIPSRDIPAPGDYDGGGKTDIAVLHRDFPQSYFYILEKDRKGYKAVQWGDFSVDTAPITYDYIRAAGF